MRIRFGLLPDRPLDEILDTIEVADDSLDHQHEEVSVTHTRAPTCALSQRAYPRSDEFEDDRRRGRTACVAMRRSNRQQVPG